MHDSQLLPIKDVMYEQAPFIDLAINRLTLTGLLIHAPHRHSTEEIAAWLKQGRWAYLNPQPEQPLLVWYEKKWIPNPAANTYTAPACRLLEAIPYLRRHGRVIKQKRPNELPFYNPPYRARPQEYIPEDPIWRVQYRDELWFADYPGLAIMQASGKQGALNYQGYLPTFQQPEEKKLTLQFFPGQGPDRNHTQTIRTGDGAPAVTFDGDRVEELGWAQANVCRDKLDITLRSRAHKALILFPALGTPALLCGQGKQLKIILAVSDAFHQAINAERQTNPAKSIGPMTLRRLHAQLRLKPWGESDKHHPDLDRIYENWQTAQENIRLYPRGELKNSSETGLPVSDNNGKCIGILHPDIIDFYRKHGYTRLYQVNLNKLPPSPGLYNLVWHYPDDEEEDPSPIDKESHHGCSHEPQDRLQADYFSQAKKQGGKQIDRSRLNPCDRRRRKQPELTGDGRYTGGTPFSEGTAESGLWLESRHPVYISNKPKLNPGHLSDLHLSSRQALYPDSPAQLIPGADTATSPPLGPQSHHNAAALKRLLDAMGKDPEIDLLLLTGDLYDHAINADPAHEAHQSLNTPGDLWRAMDQAHHNDRDRYPRHIDALYAVSLIHHFIDRYQKPVCYIDGNHEAYEMPYGISPRLSGGNEMFMFLHGQRANAGIPADHGLTIYEAALLYGPGYGHYHTLDNFKADNLCWLHHLITPWRDWVTAHGKQQTWIGLGWGDDEEYAGSTVTGGGSLPRANQACTDDQWALVQNAVEKDPAAEKLLLSHFTYVNYATDIPLTTGNSKIDADDVSPGDIGPGDRDNLDEGSFHDNRKALYETYLLPGKIHYTFSGHSHRAGVYRLTGEPGYLTRKITTRGDYPDDYTHPGGTACLLVAGSGGPITRQNREGEYAGYGMEAPQGLKLDTESGKVSIVRDAQTRPRMAVLLDYLWYEGEHKALQYGLKGDGRQFRLRLDQRWINASEHGGKMLDEIHLHLHSGGKAGYQGYIQLKQTACEASQWTERVSLGSRSAPMPVREVDVEYEVAEEEGGMSWGDLDDEKKEIIINGGSPMYFLSIHLKQIEHGGLHNHYDYDSPWCFPAKVSESGKGENRLVTIRRKGGGRSDVPDFEDIFDNPKLLGEIYDY